eukprot:m.101639 g.101639  ORF g.101639 m.101639 type:complete len:365 (+) comp14095_c0_seq3:1724-2818(+)
MQQVRPHLFKKKIKHLPPSLAAVPPECCCHWRSIGRWRQPKVGRSPAAEEKHKRCREQRAEPCLGTGQQGSLQAGQAHHHSNEILDVARSRAAFTQAHVVDTVGCNWDFTLVRVADDVHSNEEQPMELFKHDGQGCCARLSAHQCCHLVGLVCQQGCEQRTSSSRFVTGNQSHGVQLVALGHVVGLASVIQLFHGRGLVLGHGNTAADISRQQRPGKGPDMTCVSVAKSAGSDSHKALQENVNALHDGLVLRGRGTLQQHDGCLRCTIKHMPVDLAGELVELGALICIQDLGKEPCQAADMADPHSLSARREKRSEHGLQLTDECVRIGHSSSRVERKRAERGKGHQALQGRVGELLDGNDTVE